MEGRQHYWGDISTWLVTAQANRRPQVIQHPHHPVVVQHQLQKVVLSQAQMRVVEERRAAAVPRAAIKVAVAVVVAVHRLCLQCHSPQTKRLLTRLMGQS